MSKEEIQKEIDICKTVCESSNEKLVELVRGIFKEKLFALESQLKSEQPKLRHGACGLALGGRPFVIVEQNSLFGSPKAFFDDQSGQIDAGKNLPDAVVLIPDIFKCLADMSKDLEEFKLDVHKYYIDERPFMVHAPIYIAGNWHTLDEAQEFHRNFGRVIATVKRRAGQI